MLEQCPAGVHAAHCALRTWAELACARSFRPDSKRMSTMIWQRSCSSGSGSSSSSSIAGGTRLADWIICSGGQVRSVGVSGQGHDGLGLVATQVIQ